MSRYIVLVEDEDSGREAFGPFALKRAEAMSARLSAGSRRYTGNPEDAEYSVAVVDLRPGSEVS